MAVTVTHATTATGTDNGNGEIHKAEWNAGHTVANASEVGHDHDGSPESKLAGANTHQSPDTDSSTSALHHTIGSGANQAAAGNHTHASPPGTELDYVTRTTSASITATTESGADTVLTRNSVSYDGSTAVIIEAYFPSWSPDSGAAGRYIVLVLWEDSGSIGQFAFSRTPAAAFLNTPCYAKIKRTPSAGSHTYSIKAFVNSGTGAISAGATTSADNTTGFMRITRA